MSLARRNMRRGEPSSVRTPSPTAFMWLASIASEWNTATFSATVRPVRASSSGAAAFWPILSAHHRKASHDAEEILIGEIDLGLIEETRRNWPFLRDRRIDAYAPSQNVSSIPWPHGRRTRIPSRNACSYARNTPRQLGYRMPPNGNRMKQLGWPGRTIPKTGRESFRHPWLYAEIVRLLSVHELVHLIVETPTPNSACVESWSGRALISTG